VGNILPFWAFGHWQLAIETGYTNTFFKLLENNVIKNSVVDLGNFGFLDMNTKILN
jgi:hypothetical protein